MDELTEARFRDLQDKHYGKLKEMSTEICLEDDLGTLVVQALLKKELNRIEALAGNASTITMFVDGWVKNFKENLIRGYIPDECDYFGDYLEIRDSCIVVGAGPSLTDEQIDLLKKFQGKIICTNKSLHRLLDRGVIPHIVPTIHSTEEIAGHFDHHSVKRLGAKVKYLLCTSIHPSVPEMLFNKVGVPEENVYWFHSYVPDELIPNYNTLFSTMVKAPTIDTGGNVGLMSIQVGQHCHAKTFGLLGMEHCVPLNPKWSNEEAQDFNIVYAPEDDLHFALTPVMRNYLQVLNSWYKENQNDYAVWNLTPNGLFYVRRNMKNRSIPYMEMSEFVRGYD